MTLLIAYLVVVVPLGLLALAAVWRPRPWQVALILAGPLVSALAVVGVSPAKDLGWVATIGVGYLFLVVLPVLPWSREWARTAMPLVVLAISGLLVGLAQGSPAILVVVALPATLSLGALVVAALSRRDRRRRAVAQVD
ncbi:hypothetical protein [uncultured Phycicoccus sp.]|uniref:hypothetical protein n=1 Tax=uncultured Phycicoccus sp. TaxID=661422 RepID=UPI0026297105|nr:hypothetical protein [uncultured Phycicoccus sp.]